MKKYLLSSINVNNKDIKSIIKNIKSGWISYGNETIKLEKKIEKKLKIKNIILTNSCTSGLHACLVASKLKKNDVVLTSPFTFISTINTLYQMGAKIKLCDINLEDFNISTDEIIKKKNKKTKFLLPTHYGGNPINIESIKKKLKNNKIKIIEDAATALGSKINKKYTGSYKNTIAVFSLYSNKIITSIEGGIIAVDNNRLAKKIRKLISMGITKPVWSRINKKNSWKYELNEPGYKYNFTDLQSSLLINQFERLGKIIKKREVLRKAYIKYLGPLLKKNLISLQKIKKGTTSSNYIFPIILKTENLKISRNNFIEELRKNNVFTTVHYIPCHKFRFYKKIFSKAKLPNTNYIYERILSLPFHNKMGILDVQNISNIIKKIILKNEA
jgi:dTDP-4-amino-4,6-dideoxygalactose transaminase